MGCKSSLFFFFSFYIFIARLHVEITTSSDAKNQFNAVRYTSTTVHDRYQPQNDFEVDGDGEDIVQNPLDRGPFFDVEASQNVTALVGSTAYLNCRVRNLGNKTVSVKTFR